MDNCWISCQVKADIKKVYDDLIIINLYKIQEFGRMLTRKIKCLREFQPEMLKIMKEILSRGFNNVDQILPNFAPFFMY